MFKKIIFVLIFSLVAIGSVFAADATSFSVPANFEDVGDGVFVMYDSLKNPIQILSVVEFTEYDAEDYLTNDSDNNYSVFKADNDTFNFIDGSVDEEGSFEIIEIDGVKYIVDFAKPGFEDGKFDETFQNLMEFNKLNNITPLDNITINQEEK